jgi:hypothetical protein
MADSALGKLIPLAIVGAIGYYVYEMFFAAPAAAGTSTVPSTGPGTNAQPAATVAPVNTDVCSKSGALAPWLAIVQKARPYGMDFGPDASGALTIDEWCYYGNQRCTGICDEAGLTAGDLFPNQDDRGGPLNYNAFAGYARQRGFSGLGTNLRRRRR